MTTRASVGNRDNRRKAAAARQEVADKRTPQWQLDHLDSTFGKGQGAAKERAKLQARIEGRDKRKGKPEGKAEVVKTTGGEVVQAGAVAGQAMSHTVSHGDSGNPYKQKKKGKHGGHGERH
jgi:hypothetical protein